MSAELELRNLPTDVTMPDSAAVTSLNGTTGSKSPSQSQGIPEGDDMNLAERSCHTIVDGHGYEVVGDKANGWDPESTCLHMEDSGEKDPNCCLQRIIHAQEKLEVFFINHGKKLKYAVGVLALLAYGAYFIYAMYRGLDSEDQIRLQWITILVIVAGIIRQLKRVVSSTAREKIISPINKYITQHFTIFKWGFILTFVLLVITFLIVEVAIPHPENLRSLIGFPVYIFLIFIFSENPSKVKWRPICWGLGIQFVFALLILKTSWGFEAFKWLGDRISEFLSHTDPGAAFVFGNSYKDHFFAFKVLPVIVFFSSAITILYYLGVMQFVVLKLAWIMQVTMGTTTAESVNAAGNIFLGLGEAPLLIRPLIDDMTPSELHAVMTGGFSTIAGAVMASYIMFGVKASHLITASVMAAPCGLAMSKLSCPETKFFSKKDKLVIAKPPQRNLIEAASAGASSAISLVANIAANLIAFIALLAFINATLQWVGARVGLVLPQHPELTFQLICSYVLWPFAFIMGIDASDCHKVAELIGFKTFVNEFVAYVELSKLIDNRAILEAYNGSWKWVSGNILLEDTQQTLLGGIISIRSEVISTYALCGFANLSAIGVTIGNLGAMSVKQKPVIARLAIRAMVIGNIVCFLNACTAGLLYDRSG